MVEVASEYIWMVVVGFLVGFLLALAIGANDVANTFGTSVGSKVLTLRQACILGTIFETLGAVLLGAKVSHTVRHGILDVSLYDDQPATFMIGNVAALAGCGLWVIIATFFKMPVSGTHSIVGAMVGFSLVAKGAQGVKWIAIVLIVSSWFISPLLAGTVSSLIFIFCKRFILRKKDPLEPGLRFLPMFYSLTIIINLFSIFYNGPKMLKFHRIPLWGTFIISFGSGIITAIIVRIFVVPYQRKSITEELRERRRKREAEKAKMVLLKSVQNDFGAFPADSVMLTNETETLPSVDSGEKRPRTRTISGSRQGDSPITRSRGLSVVSMGSQASRASVREATRLMIRDRSETAKLFSFLQILTAIFGAFAHGGNDVSNAIGPVISIWLTAQTGKATGSAETPVWILFLGGVGISLGLWIWGRRVIQTMGEDLAKVTPSSGFSIEIGAALTVLVASNVGIPVSSTHCKVGSIVFTGQVRSRDNVDWSIFRNIVLAWILTLPFSMGFSAAFMAGLRLAVTDPVMNVTTEATANFTTAAITTMTF